MKYLNDYSLNKNNKPFFKKKLKSIRYSLSFISIISPNTIASVRIFFRTNNTFKNKILIKQSYMLLTWLYYLKNNSTKVDDVKIPSFFIQPTKQTKFTLIKSPMAHKTFSQEQFMFRFYKLTISFNSPSNELFIKNINNGLLFSFFLRNMFNSFETNFFFLKRIRYNIYISDKDFMKIF